jgi:hypothetical protein
MGLTRARLVVLALVLLGWCRLLLRLHAGLCERPACKHVPNVDMNVTGHGYYLSLLAQGQLRSGSQ